MIIRQKFSQILSLSQMESKEVKQERFGNAVLRAAEDKNLSLRKLAAASGLEYSQVQRITKGKVNLALSTILALAEGLEITPAELFSYYK
jgi:transcriptional regulator with XRE-family HTH domain